MNYDDFELVYAYTRTQAIADGVLIPTYEEESGLKTPRGSLSPSDQLVANIGRLSVSKFSNLQKICAQVPERKEHTGYSKIQTRGGHGGPRLPALFSFQ